MSLRGSRVAQWAAVGLLAMIAGYGWLRYAGNGMAYGDVLGLSGRDKDLAVFRAKAMHALIVALVSEALAVGAITWNRAAREGSTLRRLAISLALAIVASASTFAL